MLLILINTIFFSEGDKKIIKVNKKNSKITKQVSKPKVKHIGHSPNEDRFHKQIISIFSEVINDVVKNYKNNLYVPAVNKKIIVSGFSLQGVLKNKIDTVRIELEYNNIYFFVKSLFESNILDYVKVNNNNREEIISKYSEMSFYFYFYEVFFQKLLFEMARLDLPFNTINDRKYLSLFGSGSAGNIKSSEVSKNGNNFICQQLLAKYEESILAIYYKHILSVEKRKISERVEYNRNNIYVVRIGCDSENTLSRNKAIVEGIINASSESVPMSLELLLSKLGSQDVNGVYFMSNLKKDVPQSVLMEYNKFLKDSSKAPFFVVGFNNSNYVKSGFPYIIYVFSRNSSNMDGGQGSDDIEQTILYKDILLKTIHENLSSNANARVDIYSNNKIVNSNKLLYICKFIDEYNL